MHRTDMLNVLVENLPPNFRTHFHKRLSSYSEDTSGAIRLEFADGSCAEADVLVGADGINSATRRAMYLSLAKTAEEKDAKRLAGFAEARWTGTYAYRTLVETELLLKIAPGHRLASTPVIVSISLSPYSNTFSFGTRVSREGQAHSVISHLPRTVYQPHRFRDRT